MAERACRPCSHLKALFFCKNVNFDILSQLDNSSHRPEGTFDENGRHINSMDAGIVHALRPCVMGLLVPDIARNFSLAFSLF